MSPLVTQLFTGIAPAALAVIVILAITANLVDQEG